MQVFDQLMQAIADYVVEYKVDSQLAYDTARLCIMDTLGCGILALSHSECTKLLGPVIPGMRLDNGARVPGTQYTLDPVQATFNIGAMNRWLDFNDTWLAAEWGHPSDNLAGILAVADYLSQQGKSVSMHDVLTALIKAYEIQGVLALSNSFNRVGLDHVLLVKVATTAVVTQLLGGNRAQILNAISLAWVDGQSLRTYRHAPNTGSRKSWAAGDASARGVWFALLAMRGEMGYATALSAEQWGFEAVSFQGKSLRLERNFGNYVIENILFKVAFPAEFHGQTAVEAGLQLSKLVASRLDEIKEVRITTQESAMRIISKEGPLHNSADRDHCIQYMTAVALIFGELKAEHYSDKIAQDERIDQLRSKMQIKESLQFSRDYLDAEKRSIANAVQIIFQDGSSSDEIVVEYPLGHRRRRDEALPLLFSKFQQNLSGKFTAAQIDSFIHVFQDEKRFDTMLVSDFMQLFVAS